VLPASRENALTICDYISSIKSEVNPSNNYRKDIIIPLCNLSVFFKKFNEPSKYILRFLEKRLSGGKSDSS
jgi:hypothetical protein